MQQRINDFAVLSQELAELYLRYMRLPAAVGIAIGVLDPRAYSMAIRWLLWQFYPRWFSSIARTVILGMTLGLCVAESWHEF